MAKVNANGLTEEEFLKNYNPGNYERPSVTVDNLVFCMDSKLTALKILLIQRKDHPYIDCYALPGGFIDMKESAYEAACRELKEETGLSDVYMEQLYTVSQPDRDPRMRIIDISYIALILQKDVVAGDDAKNALWFEVVFDEEQKTITLENKENNIFIKYVLEEKLFKNGKIEIENYVPKVVTEEKLAFDHAELLLEGLLRLKNKIVYSDIAFNLLPDEFTLPDLQRVYEIILGKALYKKNFRDSIKEKIEPLDKKGKSIIGNNLSLLYKYKKN